MKRRCSWTASDLILLSWQTVPKELCWSEFKLLYFQSKPSLNYCKAHVMMQKVSLFLTMYLYVLKTYVLIYTYLCVLKTYKFWSTCICVLKIRGFFLLYCVWINGFYNLLESRLAYTSANLVHLLLPQHLLSAYCHRSVHGKNFSHDSCAEVLCEWAGICLSCGYDWCCALHFYFFVPWHPKDQKIDTSGFDYVKFWMFKVCSVVKCCKKGSIPLFMALHHWWG